jgi:hypothetical protein
MAQLTWSSSELPAPDQQTRKPPASEPSSPASYGLRRSLPVGFSLVIVGTSLGDYAAVDAHHVQDPLICPLPAHKLLCPELVAG